MPRPKWESQGVGEGLDVGKGKRRYSPAIRPGPGMPTHKSGMKTGETRDLIHRPKRLNPKSP